MMLFLLLETGMLGVFVALDLLLFFVFWEVGLVPMYFLINQWGGANPQLRFAQVLSSTPWLARWACCWRSRCIGVWPGHLRPGQCSSRGLADVQRRRIYGIPVEHGQDGGLLGLRDRLCHQGSDLALPYLAAGRAYRSANRRLDAPGGRAAQAGRVWLPATGAAALSRRKRTSMPVRWRSWRRWRSSSARLASYGQTDFKRLVAYSSVNHMGFVVLGIAAAALAGRHR